jgi:hypothetical protein
LDAIFDAFLVVIWAAILYPFVLTTRRGVFWDPSTPKPYRITKKHDSMYHTTRDMEIFSYGSHLGRYRGRHFGRHLVSQWSWQQCMMFTATIDPKKPIVQSKITILSCTQPEIWAFQATSAILDAILKNFQ